MGSKEPRHLKPFEEGGMKPNLLKPKRWHYTVDTITKHIRKGHRREQAFIRAGISSATMKSWWRTYHEECEEGYTDTVLIRFWTIVLEAEAEAEADIIEILRNSALNGNIKSAMYMLDKRYQWSAKQEVELSAKDDKAIEIEIVGLTDMHGNTAEDIDRGDSDGETSSGNDTNTEEAH